MAPKNVTFKSKPLHGAKGRLAALWSVTFPTGVNKSFIQWNETEWNAPFLTEARNACETSIPMIFIWMLRKWMNWTPSYFTGTLHTLWSLHKIYHVNVTYMNGYSNERCYDLWRNKCGHKWTLALWYMMSLQPGEIDQVSSIKIIIIILSTLFNSSQPFNSVFSQLILITLLQFLELPLTPALPTIAQIFVWSYILCSLLFFSYFKEQLGYFILRALIKSLWLELPQKNKLWYRKEEEYYICF